MFQLKARAVAEANTKDPTDKTATRGLLLGLAAIVLWSLTAALVALGADAMGAWPFLALATLTGGALQMGFRRWHHGELRSALILPGTLWLVTIFGFVLYGVVYPLAIAVAATEAERCGVNLINYLWPPLTVVCAVLWVPRTRFGPLLVLAIGCALAGTVLANLRQIGAAFSGPAELAGAWGPERLAPYILALVGAVVWAVYSSLLARWRDWARDYATSPVGLLAIGLIATCASVATGGGWPGLTLMGVVAAVLCGVGPQGGGYLLWELAVTRADVKTLGLLGAMTPILSTAWLCLFLRYVPGYELVLAAVLVSGAVVLSTRS